MGAALVQAKSAQKVAGQPEAVITIELRLPHDASRKEALDAALRYLDPA